MHVKELYIHPIKSLGGISVPQVSIDAFGVQHDRVYMIVAKSESRELSMVTQREFAELALIDCRLGSNCVYVKHRHSSVSLRLPLGPHIAEIAAGCRTCTVPIWRNDTQVYDVGEVTGFKQFWRATFNNHPKFGDVTLVVPVPSGRRNLEELTPHGHVDGLGRTVENSFQDLYPGHLCATASLQELNERLVVESRGKATPVSASNFRPNIVVETKEPYEEDAWDIFKTGNITWHTAYLTPRCPIPTIDIAAGERSKVGQPSKSMGKYRKRLDMCHLSKIVFGLSISNKEITGTIRVGDPVEVIETTNRC